MSHNRTLLLTRRDVSEVLNLADCMAVVENAFKLHAERKTSPPGILGVPSHDGSFHIKAGVMKLSRSYFAAKLNANFPQNPQRSGLPLIQGVIVLCDGEDGRPLAVMDSMEITIVRTGAATGVAAKYLARSDCTTVTICGCGNQGRVSLRAIAGVRELTNAFVFDTDRSQAERFAEQMSTELQMNVQAITDLGEAVRKSDICVTCTPANRYFLRKDDVGAGTFIAAVGADNEEKQELEATLLAASKVVVDLVDQCATIGELHHAIAAGLMTKGQVHAELGEIIAERRSGRTSDDEIIVFDSTGTALQDVATAVMVYERAVAAGRGMEIDFSN